MQDFLELQTWPMLLKASGQAAVLIMLVLAAQRVLGRRLGPRWRHALWLLVVLRLVLPVTIPSAVSLFNFLSFSRASAAIVSLRATPGAQYSVGNPAPGESLAPQRSLAAAADSTGQGMYHSSLSWLPLIWAAGAFVMALCLVSNHYRIHRGVARRRPFIDESVLNLLEDCKQRMGVRTPITLVETPAVDGPSLFGFVRPRLLMPPGFTRGFSHDELRFVFLHELGHVKRHDIPLGWLMAWLQILHWFNPLVWLAFWRMRVDRELACDALALSYAEDHDNKAYGRTIVKLLENFGESFSLRAPSLAGIVEEKQQMKERIHMIAQFHKSNRGFTLAGLLLAGLGLLTLTDAQNSADPATTSSAKPPGPPHVVATSPKIGVTDANPALKEITVTFDREMGGGMSWTGGGSNFPKTREDAKAHWRRDKRTCVLPVTLEAGHYYRVGINSTSYQNFRGADGIPANPSVISFRTRGGSEATQLETKAPHIVRLDPPNGASEVSSAVTELRVTFNVAMGGGMSWCGGGPNFPGAPEGKKAHWTEDGKTCVLPVELKPGSEYELGLNSPSFNNFQSAAGVPLPPVHYTFKTSDKP